MHGAATGISVRDTDTELSVPACVLPFGVTIYHSVQGRQLVYHVDCVPYFESVTLNCISKYVKQI